MSDTSIDFRGLVNSLSKTDAQIATSQPLYQGLVTAVNDYTAHGTSLGNNAQLLFLAQQGHTTVEQLVEDALGKLMVDTYNASLAEINALAPLQNALVALHNSNPAANLNDWLNNVQGDTSDLQNVANAVIPSLPIFKSVQTDAPSAQPTDASTNAFSMGKTSLGTTSPGKTSSQFLIVSPASNFSENADPNDLEFLDYGNITNGEGGNLINGLDSLVDPLSVIDPVDRAIDHLLFHPVSTLTRPFHTIKEIFSQTIDDIIHPWHIVKSIVKPIIGIFHAIGRIFSHYPEYGGYKDRENPDVNPASYPRSDVFNDIVRTFKDVEGRDITQADAKWFQGVYEVLTHRGTNISLDDIRQNFVEDERPFLHDQFAYAMKQYWGVNVLTTDMENSINASIDAIKTNGDPKTGDVTNSNILNAIIVDQNTLSNLEQMEVDIQGATRPIPGPTEAWNEHVIALMIQDHSITASTVRGWLASNAQTHDPIASYIRNFQDIQGPLPANIESWITTLQNGLANGSIPNLTTVRDQIAHSTQTHDLIAGYIRNFEGLTGALDPSTEGWIKTIQNSMADGQLQNVETVREWVAQSAQTHNLITDYIQRFQGVNGSLPAPTNDWVNAVEQLMADGKIDNVSTVRSWVAHSDVTIQKMHDLFSQVWGRLSSGESDMPWINSIINGMANGYKAGDGQLYDLAEARRELVDIGKNGHNFDQIIQDVQGRSPTASDQAYLNWVINNLSNGILTYDGAVADLAQSAATHTILENMVHSILSTPSNITLSTDVEQTLNNYQKQLAIAKNNTNTFTQIRSEFIHSQYVTNSIEGDYKLITGQNISAQTLKTYMQELAGDGNQNGIISQIVNSPEASQQIDGYIHDVYYEDATPQQLENGKEIFSGIAKITQQAADTIQAQAMNLQQTTGHVDGAHLQASLTPHSADSIVQRFYDDATNLGSDIIKRFNALTPAEKADVIGDVAQLLLLAVNPNKLQAILQAGRAGYDLYETFTQDHSGADILRSVGEPKGVNDPNDFLSGKTHEGDYIVKGNTTSEDIGIAKGDKVPLDKVSEQVAEHAVRRGHIDGKGVNGVEDSHPLKEVGLDTPEKVKAYYQDLIKRAQDPHSGVESYYSKNGGTAVFWDNEKGIFAAISRYSKDFGTIYIPKDGKDEFFRAIQDIKGRGG